MYDSCKFFFTRRWFGIQIDVRWQQQPLYTGYATKIVKYPNSYVISSYHDISTFIKNLDNVFPADNANKEAKFFMANFLLQSPVH